MHAERSPRIFCHIEERLAAIWSEVLDADVDYTISEDPVEAMSLLTAGIVTGSELTVCRAPIDFLEIELAVLAEMGAPPTAFDKFKPFFATLTSAVELDKKVVEQVGDLAPDPDAAALEVQHEDRTAPVGFQQRARFAELIGAA